MYTQGGGIIESSMQRWPYQPCRNERATFIAQRCEKRSNAQPSCQHPKPLISFLKPQCARSAVEDGLGCYAAILVTRRLSQGRGPLRTGNHTLLNRQDAILDCLQATADITADRLTGAPITRPRSRRSTRFNIGRSQSPDSARQV